MKDDELTKWINIEQYHLNHLSKQIKEFEQQLRPITFDILFDIKGEAFSLIWSKEHKRIFYFPDEGGSRPLIETKVHVRQNVIKYFDEFKEFVILKLKEKYRDEPK